MKRWLMLVALFVSWASSAAAQTEVEKYGFLEAAFKGTRAVPSPYLEISAVATVTGPSGIVWRIPLFWDSAKTWNLRISPDAVGKWSSEVASNDPGVHGRRGRLHCMRSSRPGGRRASHAWPSHFERQDGIPFWFRGDTAWGYFTDSPEDRHHRPQAEYYATTRASQGFTVILARSTWMRQKKDKWEMQIGYIRKLFAQLKWWKLIPADELVSAPVPSTGDRGRTVAKAGLGPSRPSEPTGPWLHPERLSSSAYAAPASRLRWISARAGSASTSAGSARAPVNSANRAGRT